MGQSKPSQAFGLFQQVLVGGLLSVRTYLRYQQGGSAQSIFLVSVKNRVIACPKLIAGREASNIPRESGKDRAPNKPTRDFRPGCFAQHLVFTMAVRVKIELK